MWLIKGFLAVMTPYATQVSDYRARQIIVNSATCAMAFLIATGNARMHAFQSARRHLLGGSENVGKTLSCHGGPGGHEPPQCASQTG
jgi:hypothetical protein